MRFLSSVLVLSLAACAPQEQPAAPAEVVAPAETAAPEIAAPPVAPPPMTGGYSSASLDNETVKAAQQLAVDEIYKREPTRTLVEKVEAQQQVVAGMNYRFDITMSGGARYGVTVFHSLQGSMEVTDFTKLSQ
jgi:hypothetical protein